MYGDTELRLIYMTEDIGTRLKHLRTSKKLYLRALGKAAYISYSIIAVIEAGRSKPSLDTLRVLARTLDVFMRDITGDVPKAGYSADLFTPSLWLRETPPVVIELEEFLKTSNVCFNGTPLDDEDREDIITYLEVKWEREKRKKEKGKRVERLVSECWTLFDIKDMSPED